MPAGTYMLVAQLRGFVYGQPRRGEIPFPAVVLKTGEKLGDFKLDMMPRVVIMGRVLDQSGDPIQYAEVEAEPASNRIATGNLSGDGKLRAQTDERGMYRLSGFPGKYYVKASWRDNDDTREIRTDGTVAGNYAPTYYPSAAGKDDGTLVDAAPGADVSGIDIRLIQSAKPLRFTISGIVRGLPDSNDPCHVIVQTGEKYQLTNTQSTICGRDGKFVVRGVPAGLQRIVAQHSSGLSAVTEVRIDSADATDVQLTLKSNAEVAGKLVFEGEGTPKGKIRLTALISGGVDRSLGGGEIASDGLFRITGVPMGEFEVTVDPMPEHSFLKSIQFNGATLSGRVVNIESSRASSLQIVISSKAAQLSGMLRTKEGEPLLNALAMVFLVDDSEKADIGVRDPQRSVQLGNDGRYSFKAVRPGKYRLLAIDAFRSTNFSDPASFKKLAAAGEEFEVKEGDQLKRDLLVSTAERTNAISK